MTIRFDIEEAYQAYMKKHQKEIKRETEKLIKKRHHPDWMTTCSLIKRKNNNQ